MESKKGKTLFVRNLPYSTNNEKLEKLFSEVGPIHRCFVVGKKGSDVCRGFGYVTYAMLEDAQKAVEQTLHLDGRKLTVDWADRKPKRPKGKKKDDASDARQEGDDGNQTRKVTDASPSKGGAHPERRKKVEQPSRCVLVTGFKTVDVMKETLQNVCKKGEIRMASLDVESPPTACIHFPSKKDAVKAITTIKATKCEGSLLCAVLQSESQREKKASRLIVRNLSFKVDEEALKSVFSKHGTVTEVSIPTKADGKKLGFGFVQFSKIMEASQALEAVNAQPIQGRTVAVDWSVPKDRFQKTHTTPTKPAETSTASSLKSTEEKSDSEDSGSFSGTDTDNGEVVSEVKESSVSADSEHSTEQDSDSKNSDSENSDSENSDSGATSESVCSDSELDSDSDTDDDEEEEDDEPLAKKPRVSLKTDVDDGRTLFIRNVSFDSDEDSLEDAFSQFGELVYCKLVMDPKTEHSRGVAFVQFKKKEDAVRCLEAVNDSGKGLVVDGRPLSVTVAVDRQKAAQLQKNKNVKERKDNRNLHLAREGMIRAGTQAAQGLSKEDLLKRAKVEEVKRQKLQNPSIFVSDRRLCIRNLPVSVDDKQLRRIFLKASGSRTAKITECRIMRDMTQVNSKGVAKSRGYGFVAFSEHQGALQALRNTNNNPDLFGEKRRLIVEFSLENKTALQARERRLERVQAKQAALKGAQPPRRERKKNKGSEGDSAGISLTTGPKPTPPGKKSGKVLPSHRGPKIRHKKRPSQVDALTAEKKRKQAQKPPAGERKKNHVNKMESRRKKSKGRADHFESLVNKYRTQLSAAAGRTGSKWFDS